MSVDLVIPSSLIGTSRLPATGSTANVAAALPIGPYSGSVAFLSGAAAQVAYVYQKLNGPVVDIEMKEEGVYSQYEAAVLEFSTIVNIHQTENTLSSLLGSSTASFGHSGQASSGSTVESLYPKYDFGYARRVAEAISTEAHVGGTIPVYSASIPILMDIQDYDLQSIVENHSDFSGTVGNRKVLIKKVYFRAASASWRFYGYYGGLNVVGNLSTYGQYADDSTFEVIPTWHNKLQAMAFEDSLYTRTSHYSYELHNNKLRLFPIPSGLTPEKIWFDFVIPQNAWEEQPGANTGVHGVNNMANAPFSNIPFENINAIGQHWIREYCFALCLEVLAASRGKILTLPIAGENVTLDAAELRSRAEREKDYLRKFLVEKLDKMLYSSVIEKDAASAEQTTKLLSQIPLLVYVK